MTSVLPPPDPRDAERLALCHLMHDAFPEAAEGAGGAIDQDYRIGEFHMRLRFAGGALIPRIGRALAHLAVAPVDQPDLVIDVWDSASTGRPLPMLVSSLVGLLRMNGATDRGDRGEILGLTSRRVHSALHGHDSNLLSVLDIETGQGVFWVADADGIPWYETGAPLRALLSWWFGRRGLQMVHAGAIGTSEGGLLLGGLGGSGKSTAALASLGSPLRYASDDYVLVSLDRQPVVCSIYNTAKVKSEADFERFPWMASRICNADRLGPEQQKPMMFLHESQPEKLVRSFPLRAIVLPRYIPENAECRAIPVSPMSAFKAIAPSTITQLIGADADALRGLRQLVHRVPCYLVGLGQSLDGIPPVMLELITRHSS